MYEYVLSQLEKENLLELAMHVAKVNREPIKQEVEIIKTYKEKLGLEDYNIGGKGFSQIMDELEPSSFVSKTSILLEILRIVLADKTYHPEEKDIVSRLKKRWNISEEQFNDICIWLKNNEVILDS
jgi:hypothetical protein